MGRSKNLNKDLKQLNATRERINKDSDKLVQEEKRKAAERKVAEERMKQTKEQQDQQALLAERAAKAEALAQAMREYDKTIDYYDAVEVVKMKKGEVYARCVKGGQDIKTKKFKSITKANEWKALHMK